MDSDFLKSLLLAPYQKPAAPDDEIKGEQLDAETIETLQGELRHVGN